MQNTPLVLTAVLTCATSAVAQQLLVPDGRRDVGLPGSPAYSVDVHVVDFDRDGRPDLLFSSEFAYHPRPMLRRNVGGGRFEPLLSTSPRGWRCADAVADVDGDGVLDFVGEDEVVAIGSDGTLTRIATGVGSGPAAVGDLDGDGALDVVRAGPGGLRWYRQTAPRQFAPPVVVDFMSARRVRLADFDRDGDLDVAVARDVAASALFRNDGTGALVDASALLTGSPRAAVDCLFEDLDADGDDDLLFVGDGVRSGLWLGQGGAFVDASPRLPLPVGGFRRAIAGDVNGDGLPDLVVVGTDGGHLLCGAGAGWFVAMQAPWAGTAEPGCVALLDVDADADLDLVVGGWSDQDTLLFGDGTGGFAGPWSRGQRLRWSGAHEDRYALAADVDADGDVDVVTAGALWTNDGLGGFTTTVGTAPAMPVGNGNLAGVRPAIGRVDRDAFPDLVAPVARNRFALFRGLGDGRFVRTADFVAPVDPPRQPWEVEQAVTLLALHDLDADGDLDLLCGVTPRDALSPAAPARDSVWYDDGTGAFVEDPSWSTSNGGFGNDVAFGDLTGDGRVDFTDGFVVHARRPDGRYDAIASTGWAYGGSRGGVALGDLDGDGALDVVVASGCFGTPWCEGEPDVIGWNDGHGVLDRVTLPGDDECNDVELVDADGDGDLDLFFVKTGIGAHGDGAAQLWINEGGRRFRAATPFDELPGVWRDGFATAAADFDGDGDTDVFALGAADWNGAAPWGSVWWNTTRHLSAPDLPRLGRRYELVLRGAFGGGILLGAPTSARLVLPGVGTVGLDPAAAVVVGTFAGAPDGTLRWIAPLPSAPVLVGARYLFQAAVVGRDGVLRITNRVAETLTDV